MSATVTEPKPTVPLSKRRSAPRRGASGHRARRSEVPTTTRRRVSSLPFLALIAAILGAALLWLLMINNSLAAGSFEQARLKNEQILLGEQEQALRQEVQRLSSPTRLRESARAAGLIPAATTAYFDVATGEIWGTPLPAGQGAATPQSVDPVTGLPLDPTGAAPVDPATGLPLTDPATGLPLTDPTAVDPATGSPSAPTGDPAAGTTAPGDAATSGASAGDAAAPDGAVVGTPPGGTTAYDRAIVSGGGR